MKFSVAIVGAGASGFATAARLLEKGIEDIVILEAEDRVGGRVHSCQFDGSTIDLGAQWVHGEGGNVVHDLAQFQDEGLLTLDEKMTCFQAAQFVSQDGEVMGDDLQELVFGWMEEIMEESQKGLKRFHGSLGDYITEEFESRLSKHPEKIDHNLARRFLEWYEKFENSIDGSDRWRVDSSGSLDLVTSGSGHLDYVECDGQQLMSWKKGGYASVLDLLCRHLPQPDAVRKKVQLNKEVHQIEWSSVPGEGVKVVCKGGEEVLAHRVILTMSLGVLKERGVTLFRPILPQYKLNAIKGLAIGCVDKMYLSFPHAWWPEDIPGFCLMWTEDTDDLPENQKWTRDVFGFFPVQSAPRVLCGWIVGTSARIMEHLPDQEVAERCMGLLRRFVGKIYQIPDYTNFKRSSWYSNPHFRGSYSFRSLETDRLRTSASQLAAPLCDTNGQPVVQFAGEASHERFFSTVHGAVESGWREADRAALAINGSPPAPMTLPSTPHGTPHEVHGVVIIGAGLAGLAAAKTLMEAQKTDFILLEAQGRAGGRAWTETWPGTGADFVEAGAQWIHGEHGNALFQLANKQDLIADHTSAEGLGPYLREDGTSVHPGLVSEVADKIEQILEDCEKFSQLPATPPDLEFTPTTFQGMPSSMGQHLSEQFKSYLSSNPISDEERKVKEELYDWHVRFQVIDNSCPRLCEVSARSWGDYNSCPGRDYNNLSKGFSHLVGTLVEGLPYPDTLHLNCPVTRIQYRTAPSISGDLSSSSPVHPPVVVTCEDGRTIGADHVIVTCSLGVLKEKHVTLFDPPLPLRLSKVIENLGFSTINKIFLEYERPWWGPEEQGFQILWSSNAPSSPSPSQPSSWTRDLSGFDVIPSRAGAMLLGWTGADGALMLERRSDQEVAEDCTQLLRNFLRRKDIPLPTHTFRTRWHSNQYVRGAYSHTTPSCDLVGVKPEDLLTPVYADTKSSVPSKGDHSPRSPLVLLAGEAAHPCFYSTTHGAFETGVTQAQRILDFYASVRKQKNSASLGEQLATCSEHLSKL